jgi:hypothetical protein
MARVVFALTAAQVENVVAIAKSRESRSSADWGSASGLVAKGWARVVRRKAGASYYWRERYELTARGRAVLRLIRALKLDKIPAKKVPAPTYAPGHPLHKTP